MERRSVALRVSGGAAMIYKLSQLTDDMLEIVGGKAKGLCLLHRCGLNVPDGFVAVGIDSETAAQAAADYYEKSGLAAWRYVRLLQQRTAPIFQRRSIQHISKHFRQTRRQKGH